MKKKKLSLDREVLTRSMLPMDKGMDAGSPTTIPTTPTSIYSILTSLLSIQTLPTSTDPACPDETD